MLAPRIPEAGLEIEHRFSLLPHGDGRPQFAEAREVFLEERLETFPEMSRVQRQHHPGTLADQTRGAGQSAPMIWCESGARFGGRYSRRDLTDSRSGSL